VSTNRTPIHRHRRPTFTTEVVELFLELEQTPPRRRKSEEFIAKSKRLAGLLGLSTEWWAMQCVEGGNNKFRPYKPLAAHDYWLTVQRVRAALLEATGLQDVKRDPVA
jgi:hypothetical protein